MASTTVTKKKSDSKADDSDLKIIKHDEENERLEAEIFGETFFLDTDVNGYLMFRAAAGEATAMLQLIESLILLPDVDGDWTETELRRARQAEKDRFGDLLAAQRGFSIERMFRLMNDIIEAAGNETGA